MMETPNLEYIEKLARGDQAIRKILIEVIKEEFPAEKIAYYKSLKSKEYKKIEENVHKIKHKISILGLEKSYKIANEFEHNLRALTLDKAPDFERILIVISNYLKTI